MGRHVWIACVLACPLLAQNGWNQLNPATAPAARENAAMAFDAARGTVVLFGGRGASGGGAGPVVGVAPAAGEDETGDSGNNQPLQGVRHHGQGIDGPA